MARRTIPNIAALSRQGVQELDPAVQRFVKEVTFKWEGGLALPKFDGHTTLAGIIESRLASFLTKNGHPTSNREAAGILRHYGAGLKSGRFASTDFKSGATPAQEERWHQFQDLATAIYYQEYFKPAGYHKLPVEVQGAIGDTGFHRGTSVGWWAAAYVLEKNGMGDYPDQVPYLHGPITPYSKLPESTKDAIAAGMKQLVEKYGASKVNDMLADAKLHQHHVDIRKNGPHRQKYLNGWTNRLDDYRQPDDYFTPVNRVVETGEPSQVAAVVAQRELEEKAKPTEIAKDVIYLGDSSAAQFRRAVNASHESLTNPGRSVINPAHKKQDDLENTLKYLPHKHTFAISDGYNLRLDKLPDVKRWLESTVEKIIKNNHDVVLIAPHTFGEKGPKLHEHLVQLREVYKEVSDKYQLPLIDPNKVLERSGINPKAYVRGGNDKIHFTESPSENNLAGVSVDHSGARLITDEVKRVIADLNEKAAHRGSDSRAPQPQVAAVVIPQQASEKVAAAAEKQIAELRALFRPVTQPEKPKPAVEGKAAQASAAPDPIKALFNLLNVDASPVRSETPPAPTKQAPIAPTLINGDNATRTSIREQLQTSEAPVRGVSETTRESVKMSEPKPAAKSAPAVDVKQQQLIAQTAELVARQALGELKHKERVTLQENLNELNPEGAKAGKPDGIIGSRSKTAIGRFEKDHPTQVQAAKASAVKEQGAQLIKETAGLIAQLESLDRSEKRTLQTHLNEINPDDAKAGKVDGKVGPNTTKAIKHFESEFPQAMSAARGTTTVPKVAEDIAKSAVEPKPKVETEKSPQLIKETAGLIAQLDALDRNQKRTLQTNLNELELGGIKPLKVDGIAGGKTDKAVDQFEKEHPQALEEAKAALPKAPAKPAPKQEPEVSAGPSAAELRDVQMTARLQTLLEIISSKYRVGHIDGKMNAETLKAINAFVEDFNAEKDKGEWPHFGKIDASNTAEVLRTATMVAEERIKERLDKTQSGSVRRAVKDKLQKTGMYSGPINAADTKDFRAAVEDFKQNGVQFKTYAKCDPGHGGYDPGAVGIGGIKEKDIVQDTCNRVEEFLEARKGTKVRGYEGFGYDKDQVDLTKDGSEKFLPLGVRPKDAGTVFVSIHADSAENPNAHGSTIYRHPQAKGDQDSADLAGIMARTVPDGRRDSRGNSVNNKFHFNKLTVLNPKTNHSEAEVLIEVGYVSNRADAKKLQDPDYRDRMAYAIASGIDEYERSKGRGPASEATLGTHRDKKYDPVNPFDALRDLAERITGGLSRNAKPDGTEPDQKTVEDGGAPRTPPQEKQHDPNKDRPAAAAR